MSIESVSNRNGPPVFNGLSSDTKPTENVLSGSLFIETDTGDKYEYAGSTAGWVTISTAGAHSVRLKASDVANEASLKYTDQFSDTATADLGDTSAGACNALGLPFDSLNFTKSGTATLMTVDIHFTVNGGVIEVTEAGAETLSVTATSDGNSLGNILVVNSSGTIVAASALTDGTYYLYLGK